MRRQCAHSNTGGLERVENSSPEGAILIVSSRASDAQLNPIKPSAVPCRSRRQRDET